jgi:hypothetical protein
VILSPKLILRLVTCKHPKDRVVRVYGDQVMQNRNRRWRCLDCQAALKDLPVE